MVIKDLAKAVLEGGTWRGKTVDKMTDDEMLEFVGTMIREGYQKAREADMRIRTSLAFGPRA